MSEEVYRTCKICECGECVWKGTSSTYDICKDFCFSEVDTISISEAIDILKGDNLNRCSTKERIALDMAIKSLKNMVKGDD